MKKTKLSLLLAFAFFALGAGRGSDQESGVAESGCSTCGTRPVGHRGRQHLPVRGACPQFASLISAYAPGQEACYEQLFQAESGCSVHLPQGKGHMGNPNRGDGLCTIEASPVIRRIRGAECRDINTAEAQVRCCVHLMRGWGGHYFGSISITHKARKCN